MRPAAERGPRAVGRQVPALQPLPWALSAAARPAPRGPNALHIRHPLPGCAPCVAVGTPDSFLGATGGGLHTYGGIWVTRFLAQVEPLRFFVCMVRGADSRRPNCAVVFGVGTAGGARRGGRLGAGTEDQLDIGT